MVMILKLLFCCSIAHDFRHTFRKDVVIDLFCYRRRGHNEADEPSATQPLMYQVINKKATTRTLYADQLVQEKYLIVLKQIKWLKIIVLI
jgi:2-oxoglutarate dehydrogenase E1 component